MRRDTTLAVVIASFLLVGSISAQSTESVFSPTVTPALTDPFPVYVHNGARGLSGPWDLDRDGLQEVLVAQHNAAGGAVHVIENTGVDTWELVYSTAFLDSTASSSNARYATASDLDEDGNWEIAVVMGWDYNSTTTNPALEHGLFLWEHDGTVGSDNYGTLPATIGNYYLLDMNVAEDFGRAQNLESLDIDGDGENEILVPSDGASANDIMYVLSVDGTFETDGVGTGFETWIIESRVGPREFGNKYGGGSPYDIIAADLDGNGAMDLSYHTWNNLNFFNGTVAAADSIVFADTSAANTTAFYKASPTDDVALFGGIAADVDGDGNDEVFYPNLMSGNITVIDYSPGDDVLAIDASKVAFDAIEVGGAGGIAVGDADGDGNIELIVGGGGYTASAYNAGTPSSYVKFAEYIGGDPKDPANWQLDELNTGSPIDTMGFHKVYRDSAGVLSEFFVGALSKQGITQVNEGDGIFASGLAYMGDSDGDGFNEIVLSFQGVDDSLDVIDEVWNADSMRYDQTIRERNLAPIRPFARVISMDGRTVKIEDERLVLPSDYKLFDNYPNPFNPSTTIGFELPLDKRVSVKVYDITGRLIKTLVNNELMPQGVHQVTWDGTSAAGASVASGTYLYALEYGNFRQTRTMTLVK